MSYCMEKPQDVVERIEDLERAIKMTDVLLERQGGPFLGDEFLLESRQNLKAQLKELRMSNNVKDSKGTKFDQNKPPISWIPAEALIGCALALKYGGQKYGRDNYKQGIEYTRLADACLRHLVAYLNNENTDPESGLSHLDHLLASASMLKYMSINKPEMDDRSR